MMRILSFLLALAMCLTMAACGAANTPDSGQNGQNSTAGESAGDAAPDVPEIPAPPYSFVTETTADKYSDDEGNLLASYSYSVIRMKVAEGADASVQAMAETFNAEMDALLGRCLESGQELGDWAVYDPLVEEGAHYTDEVNVSWEQVGDYLSIGYDGYYWAGGAHPIGNRYSYLFDLDRGVYIDPIEIADDPELLCLITVDEPQIPVVYGSTVAAPFVKKTFTDLVQYYGILPNTQNTTKEVPNMIGRTGAMAQDILESEGFEALMAESEEEATVVTQIPAPGEMVPRGTIVVLYTTMTTFNDEGVYKEMSTVPDLIGERRQNAFDKATDAGLTINYDRSACWGIVETQSIPEGTRVEPGTEIFLTFVPHEKQLKDIESWQAGETESEGTNDGTGGNANTTGDAGFAGSNSDVQDVPNQN